MNPNMPYNRDSSVSNNPAGNSSLGNYASVGQNKKNQFGMMNNLQPSNLPSSFQISSGGNEATNYNYEINLNSVNNNSNGI